MCLCIITVNATATEIRSCPTPVCEVTALTWGVMRWDQVKETKQMLLDFLFFSLFDAELYFFDVFFFPITISVISSAMTHFLLFFNSAYLSQTIIILDPTLK